MSRISHREFKTRLAWIDDQWNQPNRTDWYLIQIAREVAIRGTKRQGRPGVDKFRLKFSRTDTREQSTITREQATAYSKSQLGAITGLRRKK